MNSLVVLLLCYLAAANADPSWNSLRATWGPMPPTGSAFGKLPLTQAEAVDEGYILQDPDNPCEGRFLGFRYFKDPALVVLYDIKGFIAGVQATYQKSLMADDKIVQWYKQNEMFVEDKVNSLDTFTLTAYLVDPAIICTTGRSDEQFENSPSGTVLKIQGSKNPLEKLIDIPLKQIDLGRTAWTKGKCFPAMGQHYWYNLTKEMDCNDFQPMFLLYDQQRLTGFGWAGMGNFMNSDRYEHPPKRAFSMFLNPVPTCFDQAFDLFGGFTTMHVYMHPYPWNIRCS